MRRRDKRKLLHPAAGLATVILIGQANELAIFVLMIAMYYVGSAVITAALRKVNR